MVDLASLLRGGRYSDGSGTVDSPPHELASVVGEELERDAELLVDRARRMNEREAALEHREKEPGT